MNTGPDDSAASGSLPAIVSKYLAASDRDDIDAIVACFTNDAVVLDEDRHWRGADGDSAVARKCRHRFRVHRRDHRVGSARRG